MKIALVCDDLVQHGGHEKVILDMCSLFPQAPLYTSMATKRWQKKCEKNGIELKTSFMQKLPFKKKLNRVYAPFLLYLIALESFDFDEYDVVISLSSRFAHGVLTKPQVLHISYMSTVGRMIWEPNLYFEHEDFGGLPFFKSLGKMFLKAPLLYLRIWDRAASKRPDYFITNSKTTQARIKKYYGRESEIIHPSVKVSKFSTNERLQEEEKYFFVITRLASWKRIDIAIKACGELGINLKIAGSGPDRERLEKIASAYNRKQNNLIQFLGYISENEKIEHLKNCQALILTQFEDFGITPLEAMASGTPVIAYKKGGALETVIEGKTGLFFNQQSVNSLKTVLKDFQGGKFDPKEIKRHAENFDVSKFNKKVRKFVEEKYSQQNRLI